MTDRDKRIASIRELQARVDGPFQDMSGDNDGVVRTEGGRFVANTSGHELHAEYLAASYGSIEFLLNVIENLSADIELMKPYVPLPSSFAGAVPNLDPDMGYGDDE